MPAAAVLADAVLLTHLAFVLFVIFGGALAWYRMRLAALHLPALLWGMWVEFSGAVCPLTVLELRLRRLAGEAGYRGGFIEHYVGRLLYPPGLTHEMQYVLGALLVAFNAAVYAGAVRRNRSRGGARAASPGRGTRSGRPPPAAPATGRGSPRARGRPR